MPRKIWLFSSAYVLAAVGLSVAPPCFAFVDHFSKLVQNIQSPQAGGDCMFFSLQGVTEADPVLPGNPYFAVPRDHPGFREIYSMLLAAQKSGTTVWIRTTGTAGGGACGAYAAVDFVMSNP